MRLLTSLLLRSSAPGSGAGSGGGQGQQQLALPKVKCAHCGAIAVPDYRVKVRNLSSSLQRAYVPLYADAETLEYVNRSQRRLMSWHSWWYHWFLYHLVTLLRSRFSLTDANALLSRGEMFVLSTAHAEEMLAGGVGRAADGGHGVGGVLLDIGAGDGQVTQKLAPLFDAVVATEASAHMERRLRRRNFDVTLATTDLPEVVEVARSALAGHSKVNFDGEFDCIALLNVLDRCDKPLTLLKEVKSMLRPGGKLLLAVVLPFRPFVEDGTRRIPPTEKLGLPRNAGWELSVQMIVDKVFTPLELQVDRVARVPYYSTGNHMHPLYTLDDAVFVLSPMSSSSDVDEHSVLHGEFPAG